MSYSLWRTKTGLAHVDRTVETIIALTWETALLPAVCMLTSAVIFSIRDAQGSGNSVVARTHLDLFFALLTGKLYTLGILRTLNSRTILRERLQSIPLGRQSLSRWEWAEPRENFRPSLEGAEGGQEEGTVGGETKGGSKSLQLTPTTVDVTESETLPAVAAPIVIVQPSQEGSGLGVGNGFGIEVGGRETLRVLTHVLKLGFIRPRHCQRARAFQSNGGCLQLGTRCLLLSLIGTSSVAMTFSIFPLNSSATQKDPVIRNPLVISFKHYRKVVQDQHLRSTGLRLYCAILGLSAVVHNFACSSGPRGTPLGEYFNAFLFLNTSSVIERTRRQS